jgi:hypothetical protein
VQIRKTRRRIFFIFIFDLVLFIIRVHNRHFRIYNFPPKTIIDTILAFIFVPGSFKKFAGFGMDFSIL